MTFLQSITPGQRSASTAQTAPVEIELQRPQPTYSARTRARLIQNEQSFDLDSFIRCQNENQHSARNLALRDLVANPPSDRDEFFRRLDDIEAQAAARGVVDETDPETLPAFEEPVSYDEAVPPPQYKKGLKRKIQDNAGGIIMIAGFTSIMILISALTIKLSGQGSDSSSSSGTNRPT